MQLDHDHHLSYCTNIHPAETWEETLGALQEHTLRVRDMVGAATLPSGRQPQASRRYAIGLRLSACAAEELLKNDNLPRFQNWLAEENCYVFTINGFPYGAFHGTRVKENVYRPDWSTPERLTYTNQLFEIISQLAPESGEGSVSTLPGSFKAFNADEAVAILKSGACIDLIFTDVRMPGAMDGLGLLAYAQLGQPRIPVLVSSGHLEPETFDAGGAAGFLPKPCDLDVLVVAMRTALAAAA